MGYIFQYVMAKKLKLNRRQTITSIGAAGIIGLSGCLGGDDDGGVVGGDSITAINYMDSWIPEGNVGPIFRGRTEERYADRGLAVNMSRGHGSSSTAQAVGTERADIGFAGITATASVIEEGMDDLVWISPLQPNVLSSVIGAPGFEIDELVGVEGTRAARQSGSVNWIVGEGVMTEENIDIDSIDFEVTDSNTQLLVQGDVDWTLNWAADIPELWLGAEGDGYEPDVIPFRNFTQAFGNGFVTRESFLEENREAVEEFLDVAYSMYLESIQEGPSGAEKDAEAVFELFEEISAGVGSLDVHKGFALMFRDMLMTDTTEEHGLGFMDEDTLEGSLDLINENILDDPISREDLVPDDPIVESGQYMIEDFQEKKSEHDTLELDGRTFENPLR